MKLPQLIEQEGNKIHTVSFGGLNRTDNYNDGEMNDCCNLSAERFPALYPSKAGKLIWEEEALTDIFWHKKGYLSIVEGELSFTRYAEKNKIEIANAGWYKRFNISEFDKGSTKYVDEVLFREIRIHTVEVLSEEQMKTYVGEEFAFDDTDEKTVYTFSGYHWATGKSYRYLSVLIKETDWPDIIETSTVIYMENNNVDFLNVSPAGTGAVSSFGVSVALTSEQLDNLKDMKMLFVYKTSDGKSEKTVTVKDAYIFEGLFYVDLDCAIECIGGTLYPYEHKPYPDKNTHTEVLVDEPTGTDFSEKEYLLYKDTFSKTETDEGTGEEIITPIKLADGKKQICVVGNVICIFPDKVFYDEDNIKFGYMENYLRFESWTFTTDTFEVTLSEAENPFSEGDSVTFNYIGYRGASEENDGENAKTAIVESISYDGDSAVFTFNSNTFSAEDGNNLAYTYITMTREVPDLDFVCAKGSRLYGADKDRIYVSKYGSPQNFQFFRGGAMDSYYIDVASPGEFTGCIPYSSYVLFFKENEIIKLYGEQPSDYQIVTTACSGVAPSSERSLCEAGGVIFYLGSDGVYTYSGGYPTKISLKLGSGKLFEGVGGRNGLSYYISAKGEDGERKNYTYDIQNGIWLSEDVGEVSRFLSFNGEAAYLNSSGLCLAKQGEYEDFSATFCTVYENVFNKKKYQRFYIRAEVPEGARFKVEMSRDGGDYYEIKNVTPRRSQIITVPLAPNRCDRFSVRISGRGAVKILSLMREFYGGSER